MPKSRRNVKAPDIDSLAQHYLSHGLSKHPDVSQHVPNIDDIEGMSLFSLLTLAKKMGVDADGTIRATERDDNERSDYSFKFPAFNDELPFDLTFEFLGKRITRKAKVVYEHTPEWEYFDLRKNAPYVGWPMSTYSIEVAAIPEGYDEDENVTEGEPHWMQLDDITREDVLPRDVWDAVLDAVDEHCKAEDARRRTAAEKAKTRRRPGTRRGPSH